MTNTARTIRIEIDPSSAKAGAAVINNSLASIGREGNKAQGGVNNLSNALRGANDNFAKSNNSILNFGKSIGKATLAMGALTGAFAILTVAGAAFTGLADKASQMEARLRIATNSTAAYAKASMDVVKIAYQTRSDLGAVAALYTKMSANSRTLGLNTTGVGVATRTFGMALKVSGASAQEAESSILQLSQAMASGVLQGDEFKSLAENSPVFMGILATSMGVGIGALKKLGSEGKITGQQIAKALTDPKIVADIEAKFGKIPVTFGEIMGSVRNVLVQGAGALFRGLGIDESLATINAKIFQFGQAAIPVIANIAGSIKSSFATIAPVINGAFAAITPVIQFLWNNLESIRSIALAVGAAFVVMKASMALSTAITQVTLLGGAMGFTGGVTTLFSIAMNTATGAVNGLTLALLANPLTALITALTAGTVLLVAFSDKIKLPGQEFGRLNDIVAAWWAETVNRFNNIMSIIGTFANAVKQVFGIFGVLGRKVFSEVLAWGAKTFSGIADWARVGFAMVNAATGGALGKAIGFFKNLWDMGVAAFNWFGENWSKLPGMIGSAVTGAVNWVIDGIEDMVNKGIKGLNALIAIAQKLPGGGSLSMVSEISLDSFKGSGARIGAAAEARGAARARRDAARNAPPPPPPLTEEPPAPPPLSTSGANGAGADGAKSAEDRAKAVREFWEGLEASRDAAGKLGIELERHNAILELRRTLGDGDVKKARALTDAETARINTLLEETATRKAISELTQSAAEHARERSMLEERASLLGTMTLSQVNDEMAVRERMAELRSKYGIEGANLSNAELNTMLEQEASAMRLLATERQRQKVIEDRVSQGRSLIERYSREADPAGWAARDRDGRGLAIEAARGERPDNVSVADWERMITAALGGSAREYDRTMSDIASKWRERMLGGIDQIADAFGGKMGEVIRGFGTAFDAIMRSAQGDHSQSGILGGISKLFGGAEGNRNGFGTAFDDAAKGFSPDAITKALGKPLESMSSSFSSFTNMFKQGGSFTKSLGSVMGSAMQGMNIGSAVGGIGKALFKDAFSNTGSQIGGMIGSVIGGPIGSILGSIGGGFIGGLFNRKPKPSASSAISQGANGLTATTTGNNAALQGEAGQASQSVIEGINAIAARLGADATGTANVSIGKYKHLWKVSTSGGQVGKKHGQDFGEDAEAAIKFAIQDAIRDGVLVGLSSFSDRLLKSSTNLDSALSLAESYEKLLKELGSLKDPVGSSIKDLTDNMSKMVKMMTQAGATSEELAKVEEYKKLKLDAILKDQLGSLYDFRRELTGEGSGISAFNRLSAAQGEFAKMDALIRSGGTVNQDDFTRVGQDVLGLASEVFGTSSSQFQAIRQMLMEATDGAINNVTKQFDDATVQAINQQTDSIVGTQNVTNDLLRQLIAAQGGSGGTAYTGGGRYAVNGRFDQALV